MKLVEMKCKNCGSMLEIEEGAKDVTCKYCHTTFAIDDEVQHVQHDNMYESGYEFEKGRMQAQSDKEAEEEMNNSATVGTFNFVSFLTLILIIIALVAVFLIVSKQIINGYEFTTKSKEEIFSNSYSEVKQKVDQLREEEENEIETRSEEFDKRSFNMSFELYNGTQSLYWVKIVLDEVVSSNKKYSDHLVTVVYKETSTSDPNEIINLKHSLKDNKEYEVILDYDENGYINLITLMDV